MSELGIPVDIEKSEISSCLNSFILLVFGMGMYTVIYFGTIYIFLTRGSPTRRVVPATITMLFLCNIIQIAVRWYITKWQFVDNGDTRNSVFVSLLVTPQRLVLTYNIFTYIAFVLADGLLIWRCFHVWSQSFRVISVPLLLIIAETALFFIQIVFQAIYGDEPPKALLVMVNDLLSTAYFAAFGTSLVTTVLIAYKIYSVSKEGVSDRKFMRITDIVVQSGAVYSLTLLVTAISGILLGANVMSNTLGVALNFYTAALVNVIAGISATILVARVSMLSTVTVFPSTSTYLSGIQFHAPSTQWTPSPEEIVTTRTLNNNGNAVGEGLDVEGKVQ